MANIKKTIPVNADTRFNVGSITKQFTAACIHLLEEQGKLNRNDSIQKYIPELPSFGNTITLNHLLAHTSGIPDHMEILGLKRNYSTIRLDPGYTIEFLKKAPFLTFKPGENFAYCNTGYMLLAITVARVSGMSIQQFAQKNIFIPLNMKSAIYTNTEADGMPDGTVSYSLKNSKYKVKKKPQRNALGSTGVFGTLRDFVKWNQNLSDNQLGEKHKDLTENMQKTYYLNDGSSINYGGGLILKPFKGNKCIEHAGGWNNFLAQFRTLPNTGITVLIASNTGANSPFAVCDEISDLLLHQKLQLKDTPGLKITAPITLAQIAGNYAQWHYAFSNNQYAQGYIP